ncbi:MAG: glucokinase [Thermoanaerobaculia bacterium]|nr:glucokinase [Thermoanaerobaculia bacterium]
MRVLAADVGGTNCRLALFETEGFRALEERIYPSREYGGLDEVVGHFAEEIGDGFRTACFGVAGPVRKGRAELTNLPWVVDAAELRERLGHPVAVINDLEAAAWSLELLSPGETAVIREGSGARSEEGNRALIAPGTGLGEAGLFWDGSEHRPFPTEGSHADFAPRDSVEWELRSELALRFGRVSWERVVSGPGRVEIHRFLCSRRETEIETGCPVEELAGDDEALGPAITRGAREGNCEVCAESLDRFCRLLGAEAGNLALKLLATGGVWIGGGIAPSIVDELREGSFLEGFLEKGRMREIVAATPVSVILAEKAGLRGAARVARRLDLEKAGQARRIR